MQRNDAGGHDVTPATTPTAPPVATPSVVAALRAAHRANDLDAAHDLLCHAGEALLVDDVDGRLALAWQVALDLVTSGAARAWPPRATVTDIATELAGHLGVVDAARSLDAWMERSVAAHSEAETPDAATVSAMRAAGQTSRRLLATTPDALDARALRAALAEAYDDLDHVRAERDAFEGAAVAGEGARRLAVALGEELERDEWIRARIRRVKSTLPMRAAFRLRRLTRARTGH
jgi:hypothetical protein